MAWSLREELRVDPVVVTGRGAVSGCGPGVSALLEAARAGRPGGRLAEAAGKMRAVCLAELPAASGGRARRMDPSVQFALTAAAEALAEAGLEAGGAGASGPVAPARLGVVAGTSRGCQGQWEAASASLRERARPRPGYAATTTLACLSGTVAQLAGARGPGATLSATCASGAAAIKYAAEQLVLGQADAMLAGGADSVRSGLVFPGMEAAGLLGTHGDPARVCRPFEAGRDGLLLGEGAAFVVLERASHARARGARIFGAVSGWALEVFDGGGKTGLDSGGTALAGTMRLALAMAGRESDPEDFPRICYVNAHGTGTRLNDAAETAALRAVFPCGIPPVSSTKPVTGHCLGATPVLEAVITLAALEEGWLPPQPPESGPVDPALQPLEVVRGRRTPQGRVAISNSLGFWGYHASLVLERADF